MRGVFCVKRVRKPLGWVARKKDEFQVAISNRFAALNESHAADHAGEQLPLKLATVTEAIVSVSLEHGSARRVARVEYAENNSQEYQQLLQLRQERRMCRDSVRRAGLSKLIFSLRRKLRRARHAEICNHTFTNLKHGWVPRRKCLPPVPVLLDRDGALLQELKHKQDEHESTL